MDFLNRKFKRREARLRRNYEISDTFYTKLEQLTLVYDANLSDLVNACIEQLIQNEQIAVFGSSKYEPSFIRTLSIRESNLIGLENLKQKYGVSINKLVNIAIKNVLDEYESEHI